MSEEEYNNKLKSVQRFIPFLENMIDQLKDPKMRNREQQLTKMESLYGMITDKKKKLKIETLQKCEEVIFKLYQKVKGDHAQLPRSEFEKTEKEKKSIYDMAGESLYTRRNYDEFDITPSGSKSEKPKSFFLRKPPISYADLEGLEKDVANELESKMSLQELNTLRHELCQQLEETQPKETCAIVTNKPEPNSAIVSDKVGEINTTVRNKQCLTKISVTSDKTRKSSPVRGDKTSPSKKSPETTKTDNSRSPKTTTPKILKESGDIFGNAFSEIDKTYELGMKKREERKNSLNKDKKENDDSQLTEKIAQVKHLAEKAAALRNKFLSPPKLIEPQNTSKPDLNPNKPPTHESEPKNQVPSEETSKPPTEKETAENISRIDSCNFLENCINKTKDENEKDKLQKETRKGENQNKEKKSSDHKKEHKKSDHKKDEKRKDKHHSNDRNKKDAEKDKKPSSGVAAAGQKLQEPPPVETKPASRDPRLKFRSDTEPKTSVPPQNKEAVGRLAYKYNPKPKRVEAEVDIEKNVADSIEKSMKESNVPLPPKAQLAAPPVPPNDLFSPQSPDEMNKTSVPNIINEMLLNPTTSGVINDVMTALKRSNNDHNLINVPTTSCLKNNDVTAANMPKDIPIGCFERQRHPLFPQFTQKGVPHFSPPPTLKFIPPQPEQPVFVPPQTEQTVFVPPPTEQSVFVPPKPLPPLNNMPPRGFNSFFGKNNVNICEEMPVLDYQPPLESAPKFDGHMNPPHLTPYEDRMQGFHMNFVPPSPSYVPPSPSYVPPSPSYVPPSPVYDGGNENYRDMNNFQNFPLDRPQFHFDKGRSAPQRQQSLLGDFPARLPFEPKFGQQNFGNNYFYDQGASGAFKEGGNNFFGAASRDPRVNSKINRNFNLANDPRIRDNRMTYREYKEQRERETREREMKEKEMREKEVKEKELQERQQRETEANERLKAEREEREKQKQKIDERKDRDKRIDGARPRDHSRDRGRSSSRDRYSRNRSSSRYRRDRNEPRDRSRERPRFTESRFDKVYSSRDQDKEDFTSPLDSLYSSSTTKTGKGYGIQFKIPKKVKEENQPKKDDKPKKEDVKIEKKEDVVKAEVKEELAQAKLNEKKEVEKENEVKEDVDKKPDDEATTETKNVPDIETKPQECDDVVEVKEGIPVIEVKDSNEEEPAKIDEVKQEKPQATTSENQPKEPETKPNRDEEESILGRFFQNLMKSTNKDEKKGALLSLISTFSDSFSDHQLKRITNIIKCEENEEETESKTTADPNLKNEEEKSLAKETVTDNEMEKSIPIDSSAEKIEDKPADDLNLAHSEETVAATSVQVSVGERIKNRKRCDNAKTENKSKNKLKTELDRLHEDIREMFIRDGVVTATGKRMCRLLKDTTVTPTDTEPEKTEDEPSTEESKKGKKKGRKATKKTKDGNDVEMKELSVVLPKMSLDKMKQVDSEKRYSLRKPLKTTNYSENEVEEDKSVKKITIEIKEAVEVEPEKESIDESEKQSNEETKKVRAKKKPRKSWASGVIKKKSGGKLKKTKSPTPTPETLEEPVPKTPRTTLPENAHDVDHYITPKMTKLACKICSVPTKWIAAHYRSEHPDIEVLSSRLPPDDAKTAIEDALKNKEIYEDDVATSTVKHEYNCRFCDYNQTTLPRMYRDHVSIHTGEFRHRCPYCNFQRSHIKSMQNHVNEVHASEEAIKKTPIISQPVLNNRNIYAYICEICHFVQMDKKTVENHAKNFHSDSKNSKIHLIKINVEPPAKKARSPRKPPKSKANPDEQTFPEIDLEGTKSSTERDDDNSEPPLLTKEIEELEKSSSTLGNDVPSDAVTEDSETTNLSQDEVQKTTKKRKKPFVKPTRKRLRRRVGKLPISSTDTESDADFQKKSESKNSKKICEAVFTCNTDLQEENKQIEEERMKMMQDINSTLQVRTSLDFVEKLSNRLKQEEEVVVKQEPEEVLDDTLEKAPPSELPVFEKSALQKRDIEQTVIRQDNSAQNVDKLNPISGVIEKLQGILSGPAPSIVEVNSLPPLTHKDQVERKSETLVNSVVLNIGPLKIIKNDETFIYACCSRPCIFSSRDVNVFKVHCESAHDWDANLDLFPNCMECNMKFDCDENNSLLSVALNHVNQTHPSFLGIKIGSIRISSNLFPKDKPPDPDDVDVKPVIAPENLGDVTPPTLHLPSPPGEVDQPSDLISTEVLPKDFENENPFSFKIVDVMSLATDDDVPPLSMFENCSADSPPPDDGVVENTSVTDVGPASPIKGKTTIIISQTLSPEKSALSPTSLLAASKGKKSANAMKKFLSMPNDLFKCPEYACLFTTNNKKMFDIHVKMHPNFNVKALPCLYCEKIVVLEKMGEHYGYVHSRCRFCCVYCFYRCIAKDYMYIHQLLVHRELVPRLQLLPRRESDEKRSMEFLHESTKKTQLTFYECCGEKFLHYMAFYYHVKKCMISTAEYRCHYQNHGSRCTTICQDVEDVLKHWVRDHKVYPFQCSYCDEGSYSVDIMMIHLVKEHPMLPPDVVDRRDIPIGNKSKSAPSKAKCRFKQLAESLRTNTYKQLSLEEDVLRLGNLKSNNVVTTFPKVTPVTLVQTLNSSISLLKPTTKADVLASGGVVYCLGAPPPNQNQPMKALVVNDSAGPMSQKVRLLAPVKVPPNENKYQVLKNMGKIFAVTSEPPKLAPLGSRIILPKLQTGADTLEITPVVSNGSGGNVADGEDGGFHVVAQEAEDAAKDTATDKEGAELPVLEEPVIMFDGEFDDKTSDEAVDPLSLETEDPLSGDFSKNNEIQPYAGGMTPFHEYDSDSKDIDPQVVTIQKAGLIGYQLYRCAKCDLSFSEHSKFKDHLIRSQQCKFTNTSKKPYKCVHCGKFLKQHNNLLDHLGYHGHLRFLCSLCNKKYPHANQAKYHMKTKHNIVNMVLQPLVPNKTNLNNDEFVVKPQAIGMVKPSIKETTSEGETQKCTDVKTIFFSHEADDIPQKSILSYDITCGHCKKFKNKVRSNIVRHLLLHKNDKDFTVPDTAPVNPVPCLEKNEKMFDKMYNLASSSHAGGRMGGQQKTDAKKQDNLTEENHPGFVPTNKRFQCCAVGCNYLCLEEGNLRHHLTALHMEDLNFICVHCKKDLSDAVDVDTILKHLKLHDLHLYKCSICDFMHNLKHKIERHIGEKHKNKECTVVVLRAMDSEPYEDTHHQALASFPVVMNQRSLKSWRCCMCKYKCHTQEEAENHAKNKHDIDCRYKCALCTYKSNIISEFTDHFKTEHPDSDVDIILVYHKEDESHEAVSEHDQFDTTPLWLRDKPRVRHIRGILFDENSPIKKKGAPLKTIPAEQSPNASTGPAAAKKRKRSVSTYAETPKATEEDEVDPKREVELRTPVTVVDDDVIVIEDDEETPEPSGRPEPDPVELLCTYGETGMPLNNQFKCPKCDKYRTSKVGDFVQHLATEIKYYRFSCILCNTMFVTMESIKVHCIDCHECSLSSILPLNQNDGMHRWITLVLEEQRNVIRNLGLNVEDLPDNIESLLGVEVLSSQNENPAPSLVCKECGLVVSAIKDMELHVKFNHPYLPLSQTSSSPQSATSSPIIVQEQPKPVGKKRKNEITFAAPSDVKKAKLLDTNLISKDLYTCVLCNLVFESVPEMEFHGRKNHGGEVSYTVRTTDLSTTYDFDGFKNVLRCCYCTKLGSKQALSLHIIQDHPAMKPLVYKFSCGICQTKFENLKPLRRHLKTHDLVEIPYYDIHDREFTFKPRTNLKNKIFSCPICPYVSNSSHSTNMKTHLKIHAKPFQCDLCNAQFKNRPDARTHHLREHPHNTEMISVRDDMMEKLSALMIEVMNRAQFQEDKFEEEANKSDSLVEANKSDVVDVDLFDIEDLTEVDSQHSADNSSDETVKTNVKSTVAKKSTTSLLKPDETKEYYSFYGLKPDPVDLRKIITTFEVGDAKMRMTCDQLGRIYNLKTQIVIKDCLTLIVDCEDDDE